MLASGTLVADDQHATAFAAVFHVGRHCGKYRQLGCPLFSVCELKVDSDLVRTLKV